MIEANIRIRGAGKISRIVSRTGDINLVTKKYTQRDNGSAYKKIACDIMCIVDAYPDVKRISLIWEHASGLSDGNIALIRRQIVAMKKLYPAVEMKFSMGVDDLDVLQRTIEERHS